MQRTSLAALAALAFLLASLIGPVEAGTAADSAAVTNEQGKYFDANGDPTYKIQPDGTIDWFTYSGFRRYHSECHVCHGPEGMGSSYAPALVESLKVMDYAAFTEVVVNGRQIVSQSKQSVMPSFGLNQNVMCYLDDIYVYLRARSDGALPRGRPSKRENKSDATREAENACLGH